MGATTFNGRSFSQLTRLNVLDELRIGGIVVDPTATGPDILITAVEDFPNQDAAKITFQDGEQYRIAGDVNLGNKFIEINPGATVTIYGRNPFNDSLTSGTTGAMFRGTNCSVFSFKLGLTCANGTYFNFDKSAASPARFSFHFFSQMIYSNCVNFADVDSINVFALLGSFVTEVTGRGIVATSTNDTFDTLVLEDQFVDSYSGTLVDLGTSQFRVIEIIGNQFKNQAGNILLAGAANGANIITDGQATVRDNVSSGDDAGFTNITTKDLGWQFIGNNRISDSLAIGSLFMEDNATATLTTTQNVPVLVAGTTTEGTNLQRWDMPQNNRLRYLDRKSLNATVVYSITAQRTSGSGTRLYNFTIYQNGSPLTGGTQVMDTDNRERNLTVQANVEVNQNDFFELFVTNTEGSQEITVTQLQASITE